MVANISLPNLRAWATLDRKTNKAQIADQIGTALGLRFGSDSIGWFEELDALVGKAFYFIIGVYEVRDANDRINIELRSLIDRSLLSAERGNVEIDYINVSGFLSLLLRTKTGMPIYPIEEPSQKSEEEGILIPNLHVSLGTETYLPLEQITARVGVALGLYFGQTVSTLEKGLYHGQPWYMQTASSLEHQMSIYAATAHHRVSVPRPVILELRPDFESHQLGLGTTITKVKTLDISIYVASMLQVETNLTFTPLK